MCLLSEIEIWDWKIALPVLALVVAIPLVKYLLSLSVTQKFIQKTQMMGLVGGIVQSVIHEVEKSSEDVVNKAGGKKKLAVQLAKEAMKKMGIKEGLVPDSLLNAVIEEVVSLNFDKKA